MYKTSPDSRLQLYHESGSQLSTNKFTNVYFVDSIWCRKIYRI